MLKSLSLDENETDMIEHAVEEMETEMHTDREAALVDMRYQFIDDVCKKYVVKPKESRESRRTDVVGAVLMFVPIIVVLFLFLSMLEDLGYMARIAYIMDKPLRKIGLSGRSFVPMLMGFGRPHRGKHRGYWGHPAHIILAFKRG
jgi:Fe2+ transport system protein B